MNALLYVDAEAPPRSLVWDQPMSDDAFMEMCRANDFFHLERTREGEVVVHAPAGGFTSRANSEIILQLRAWWKTHRRGEVFDCNCGFFLEDGSMLSPDAAYVAPEKIAGLGKEEMAKLLYLAPNFIIELLSKTDTVKAAQEKMEFWIENGVELGWLIDPYKKRVFVYKPGSDSIAVSGDAIEGIGAVEGFTLDLTEVWRCYEI